MSCPRNCFDLVRAMPSTKYDCDMPQLRQLRSIRSKNKTDPADWPQAFRGSLVG